MSNNIPLVVGELVEAVTANTWARGYFRKNTAKTVNGTTTATDLFNGEFTLPANAMSTDKIVRVSAWGDWKQHAGSDKDLPAFRLGLGATTLIDTNNTTTGNIALDGTTRFGWSIRAEIQNLGAANSQQAYLTGDIGFISTSANDVDSAPFTTGNGVLVVITGPTLGPTFWAAARWGGGNTTAVDTTASCALTLKVVNNSSSANYETKLFGALVEVI